MRLALEVTNNPSEDLSLLIIKDVQERSDKAFTEISKGLPGRIKEVFVGQGKRDGEGDTWKKTTKVALRARKTFPRGRGSRDAKEAYYKNAPTLVDTQNLYRSIDLDWIEGSGKVINYWFGSSASYAPLHELGGSADFGRGEVVVPRRQFLFITEKDKEYINANFVEAMNK